MSAKKKAFFHHEAKGLETYTKSIVLREHESSVAEVIQTFTKSFQLDHPDVDLGRVEVTDSSGNTFQPSDDLFSLLRNKDDCYVVTKKKKPMDAAASPPDVPASKTATTASVPAKDNVASPSKVSSVSSPPSQPASAGATGDMQLDYEQTMRSVDDLVSQRALRRARELCLAVLATDEHRGDIRVLEQLCSIAFQCRQYSSAVTLGERALRGFSSARAGLPPAADDAPLLLSLLRVLQIMCRSQAAAGDHEEALERAAQGLHLLSCCCKLAPASPGGAKLSQLPATVLQGSYSDPHSLRSEVLATPCLVPLTAPPHLAGQQKVFITLELVSHSAAAIIAPHCQLTTHLTTPHCLSIVYLSLCLFCHCPAGLQGGSDEQLVRVRPQRGGGRGGELACGPPLQCRTHALAASLRRDRRRLQQGGCHGSCVSTGLL